MPANHKYQPGEAIRRIAGRAGYPTQDKDFLYKIGTIGHIISKQQSDDASYYVKLVGGSELIWCSRYFEPLYKILCASCQEEYSYDEDYLCLACRDD
jgi:hypothetical protein